jgi:uncharacterized protein (TIGR03435 family)
MTAVTRAFSTALVDFLWQGAIIGLLLWLALTVLRNRSPNSRYIVSCAALALLLVLPVITLATLWSWSIESAPPVQIAGEPRPIGTAIPQTMLTIWLVSETPRLVWLERVQLWALPIWSAGVLLFSIRLAWGYRHASTLRRGQPSTDARLLSTVSALAARIGVGQPVRVIVSALADGPAAVGWLRPVLLLPPATAMGLTASQLEAVIAHELAHVKRHDYLVNLIQIVAETLFFYHPAVWWTSKQIRAERELCCDDIAVRASGDPVDYARALTMLARQQLGSPAPTLAATGGSLVHRVQRLVGTTSCEGGPARAPGTIVAALAIACVLLNLDWLQAFGEALEERRQGVPVGQVQQDQPRFEVASVKVNRLNDRIVTLAGQGGRFTARGLTLRALIQHAYQVQEFQIVDLPDWTDVEKYDIAAREPETVAPSVGGSSGAQRLMLRALLEDRFGLAVHKETRERPVYALVLARSDGRLGPELRRSTTDCSPEAIRSRQGAPAPGPWQANTCGTSVGPGLILAGSRTMAQLATAMSSLTNTGSSLNRIVVDRTGLEGTFDLTLRFTPENVPDFGPAGPPARLPAIDPNGPSIFTAVQEQLGLKLDSQRGPVEVLVIDRVQRPTED